MNLISARRKRWRCCSFEFPGGRSGLAERNGTTSTLDIALRLQIGKRGSLQYEQRQSTSNVARKRTMYAHVDMILDRYHAFRCRLCHWQTRFRIIIIESIFVICRKKIESNRTKPGILNSTVFSQVSLVGIGSTIFSLCTRSIKTNSIRTNINKQSTVFVPET